MQIPVHLIGAPAPDEAYPVTINAGTQESHGPAGARGTGGNVLGGEAQARGHGDSTPKERSDEG